jgi:dipeptidyl-peptidase-4
MDLYRADGRYVAAVHTNPQPKLQSMPMSEWEFTTFETGDGVTLNAALLRPRNFDPARKYPVLMHTYGGPNSQVARNAYGNGGGLEQFFAANDVIYALVDGRGSGGRGRDFKKITYLKLGHYEVNDQIEGAKWLGSLPYVDAQRIGIWGWSYGGYMASLCILRGAEVFRTAAAVAPVTHWGLYDSIYTERYMRRPVDNPEGYAATAPLADVEKLKGRFLLVHGLADDNVHFQHAAQLAAALQKGGKQFRAMYYPGKHHGLEGMALHWATLITDFFLETL